MIGTPCSSCSGNGKVQADENVTVKILGIMGEWDKNKVIR